MGRGLFQKLENEPTPEPQCGVRDALDADAIAVAGA